MGVKAAVVRVAAEVAAAPNTQDITTADLGGLTPKAALLIVTNATVDGVATDHYVLSYGAATGAANEWVMSHSDEHGQGTTDSYHIRRDDACVAIIDPTDGSIDGEAEFNSFIANGIRINWVDEPAAAYLITAILFAGTDLSVHADKIGLGNVIDLETNCEQPGFEPDVLFTAHIRIGPDVLNAHAQPQFGLVHWDGNAVVTERCFYQRSRDDRAVSEGELKVRNDYGIEHKEDWMGEFTNFDANGFSMITRIAGGNNADLSYLALSFGGVVDSAVGTHTTPVAPGNDAEADPGFKPQFVMMFATLAEVMGVEYADNRSGSVGFSTFDEDDEYCNVVTFEDAVGVSNTQSLSDDRAIVVPDDDGTLDIEAVFVSFDANGWTLNYTNAPAAAKVFPYLAIEEEAVGGVAPTSHIEGPLIGPLGGPI